MNETLQEFGVTLKFGTVSASKPGFARVRLADFNNMRTMWLPIAYPKTQHDQCCWTYDAGEHVAVLLDTRGEDGVILGAVYSSADTPPISDSNLFSIRFNDGACLEYDRHRHVLTLAGVQTVVVQASAEIQMKADAQITIDAPRVEVTGDVLIKGTLTAQNGVAITGGDGGKIVGDLRVQGSIHASGTIIDTGGNSNHHTH